ncbi:hypothetical protein A2803_00100 [Candidatus Woesebacteria bacterium RIFCSPHIGHO2_01_FULL_44_21]|uniref:O-antigen ligase-related domain-containing protein n=1 Tax=Candidatus Woesebacteria bacterium RIFCSPHIGHO2_01_FULL_44_21 TaxID=1802503 RepID=A0A1F7Z2U6_9BACT|nr:MAG: hypothetical protein A2803_00100 [Candidatus Woesebacteria bacterium RIFCSPHIGHO2_01_FULL_44_21]OGM71151.1 MAG: hypothetical protein A2897_02955 [Candidatus Woesebacteria bacterium RIFCSPLOWO2_01_FULL_44_24b]
MGKTRARIIDYLLLLILAIFPLGQLPGIYTQNLLGLGFRPHPIDALILFTVIFMHIVYRVKSIFRLLLPIIVVLAFSLLLSVFTSNFDIHGLFYVFRLTVYLVFLLFWLNRPISKAKRGLCLQSLLVVGGSVALFGWVQYFLFPDLTSLKAVGWDDHYFRLTSTFMDPAFTGIVLVLGILTATSYFLLSRTKRAVLSVVFLLITLGFTYSRASFLALIIGLFVLLWNRNKKFLLILVFAFAVIVVLLPRTPGGEGVKLSRVSSISQKIQNYQESFEIILSSPVFGVGYNNVCKAKARLSIDISAQKNSCYGLDNSFLLILATTGVLGLLVVFNLLGQIAKLTAGNIYGDLFNASALAVLVHSQFSNTLFYPWVIIWLVILAIISRTRKTGQGV